MWTPTRSAIVFGDLLTDGLLALGLTAFADEQEAVRVGAEQRHDLGPVPAQALGHLRRDLGDVVLPPGLGLRGRDVQDQTALRAVRLAEVPCPVKRAEILRPDRRREQDVDRDRDLRRDVAKPAARERLR